MLTEARKTFRFGFVLNEQELRRLVDTVVVQVRKALENEPVILFQVRFRNGTVTECSNVEELLSLENVGPKQITRLRLTVDDGGEEQHIDPKVAVLVRFTNLTEEDEEVRSVNYVVRGENRDWVLVTASEIEDRVTKAKCIGVRAIFINRNRAFRLLLVPFLLIGSMYGLLHATVNLPPAALVKNAIDSGEKLDPVRAVALLEQDIARERQMRGDQLFFRWGLWYPLTAFIVIYLLGVVGDYFHPSYVFAWADYTKVYDRRIAIRNYVYIGVLSALIIAVVADIIVSKLGLGKS